MWTDQRTLFTFRNTFFHIYSVFLIISRNRTFVYTKIIISPSGSRSHEPAKSFGKSEETYWNCFGCFWFIFRGNMFQIIGLKLRGIVLLRFGIIKSRFAYGRDNNSSFLWFRDFWTRHQAPKPTMFIFGDTRTPQTNQEKSPNILKVAFF